MYVAFSVFIVGNQREIYTNIDIEFFEQFYVAFKHTHAHMQQIYLIDIKYLTTLIMIKNIIWEPPTSHTIHLNPTPLDTTLGILKT